MTRTAALKKFLRSVMVWKLPQHIVEEITAIILSIDERV
jgi:hypothetical protein